MVLSFILDMAFVEIKKDGNASSRRDVRPRSRSFARWNQPLTELAQGSRLLFLAEFLESGIGAQRVPDRIESKKSRRNRRAVKPAHIWRL